jgi:uncharacterized membrane protein
MRMTVQSGDAPARSRIDSIDVLRGVIMVLMALDHTRDFFGMPGANPTDLARSSAGLFLTRWVTYFCAPVFFLLTGTGAFLALQRKSVGEMSRFLATRGAWLIFLDLVGVRLLGVQWNLDFRVTLLLVLWALGWSMIALAGLIRLRPSLVAWIGLGMIALHNLADGVRAASLGAFGPLWSILHSPGFVVASPRFTVFVAYPLIPWIGVTAVGFALGQVFLWPAERRRRWLLRAGLAATAGFVALRVLDVYGDPLHWAAQATPWMTVLSFVNTNKYPPSLLFLLMTLGPSLLALRLLDAGTPRLLRPVLVFGRVPLFYYVVHWPLIHLLAAGVCLARTGELHWVFESPRLDLFPFTPPPGWGFSLPIVYLVWAIVVVTMFPLCRWFAGVKRRRNDAWLGYF